MDLALNNLQRLICHKTQQTKSIYLSAFDHKMKATEIFKYILPFSEEKYGLGQRVNYQVLKIY